MALIFFELKEFLDLGLAKRKPTPVAEAPVFIPVMDGPIDWSEFMKKLFDETKPVLPAPVTTPWTVPYQPYQPVSPWTQPYQPQQPAPWTIPVSPRAQPYVGDPIPNQQPYTGDPFYYTTYTTSTSNSVITLKTVLGVNGKSISSPKETPYIASYDSVAHQALVYSH